MQDTVSRYCHKNNRIIITILAVVFSIIITIIVIAVFPIKNNQTKIFEEKKIYLIFTHKSLKQSELIKEQDLIKKLGGSGEIFLYKDYFYLLSSIYLSNSDADSVKSKIKTNYTNADKLTLTIKKIDKKTRNAISSSPLLLNFFTIQNELFSELVDKQILYLSGSITTREVSSYILEKKLELETIKGNMKSEFESLSKSSKEPENLSYLVYKKSLLSLNLYLLYFNNFLSKFFESSKKDSLICELAINFALCYHDLCNNM